MYNINNNWHFHKSIYEQISYNINIDDNKLNCRAVTCILDEGSYDSEYKTVTL